MADCPRCHAPLKTGAFACGVCGLTVGAAAGGAAAAKPSRRTRRVGWILAAAIAGAATLVVWQVFVREPATTGDEFVGTWRSQSMQSIGSASVSRWGDAFEVRLASGQTGEQARVTARLDGADLVITPDDFGASGDANAGKLKLLLGLAAGDFRISLSSVDPSRLLLTFQGVSPAGQKVDERTILERATTSSPPT